MHDFPVPALPITRNLNRKSENKTPIGVNSPPRILQGRFPPGGGGRESCQTNLYWRDQEINSPKDVLSEYPLGVGDFPWINPVINKISANAHAPTHRGFSGTFLKMHAPPVGFQGSLEDDHTFSTMCDPNKNN